MQRLRVLVADDQPIVLRVVRSLLEPEFEIVGEARDGIALVEAVGTTKPDVIVTDIAMPRLNGIEAVRKIKRSAKDVKVVFLTAHTETAYVDAAIEAGGSAFVLKSSAGDELVPAIREVMSGRRFVTPLVDVRTIHAMGRTSRSEAGAGHLTRKQRQVLELLAGGERLPEIAKSLGLSLGSVSRHKRKLMQVLRLRTDEDLQQYITGHRLTGG